MSVITMIVCVNSFVLTLMDHSFVTVSQDTQRQLMV